MKTKTLSVILLLALAFGALTPVSAAKAAEKASESKGVSPAGMLNADGTLKLDGSFSGALDVSGYSVEIDSERGPVFRAEGSGEANPEALGINQWGSLGGGGAVFNNGRVGAVAVHGNIVYVGGSFRNANSIPEADFVAKWNGTTWSALGSNGSGDGSIRTMGFGLKYMPLRWMQLGTCTWLAIFGMSTRMASY